jgi:hypothetical protein
VVVPVITTVVDATGVDADEDPDVMVDKNKPDILLAAVLIETALGVVFEP